MLRPVRRHVKNKKEQRESLVKSKVFLEASLFKNLLALSILYYKTGGGLLCKMVTLVQGSLQSSVLIIVCVCIYAYMCTSLYMWAQRIDNFGCHFSVTIPLSLGKGETDSHSLSLFSGFVCLSLCLSLSLCLCLSLSLCLSLCLHLYSFPFIWATNQLPKKTWRLLLITNARLSLGLSH